MTWSLPSDLHTQVQRLWIAAICCGQRYRTSSLASASQPEDPKHCGPVQPLRGGP